MRAALMSSILFYGTGMFALGFDVGRPWNFYHVILPWHWNLHSALLEVLGLHDRLRGHLPPLRKPPRCPAETLVRAHQTGYPYMVAAAFLLPAMHQSSLGSLMVIGGTKVHPLGRPRCSPRSI
jgi:Ni/Fe-hydrogenase subunit HybB-like protein